MSSGRSISALVATGADDLEQCYTVELPVVMEMLGLRLVQYSGHLLRVTTEQLKRGQSEPNWAASIKCTHQTLKAAGQRVNVKYLINHFYVDYMLKGCILDILH